MKKRVPIMMFILVAAVVGLSIFLAVSITNKPDKSIEKNNLAENSVEALVSKNEIIENDVILENEIEVENIVEEEITTPTKEEKKTSEVSIIDYSSDEMKQKAKDLVSKDWGKDDTVYFYVDEAREDGTYDVSVRDKSTTNAILTYVVDINKKTVKIQ